MNLEVARPPCDEFEHSTPQKPGLGFSLFPCQSTQALMEASAQLHLTCGLSRLRGRVAKRLLVAGGAATWTRGCCLEARTGLG